MIKRMQNYLGSVCHLKTRLTSESRRGKSLDNVGFGSSDFNGRTRPLRLTQLSEAGMMPTNVCGNCNDSGDERIECIENRSHA